MDNTAAFLERCNALMQGQHPATVLRRALEVLREPEQWTITAWAVDENQRSVRPDDPTAVAWCIEGAIAMACNPYGILPPYFMKLLDGVAYDYGCDGVNLLEEALDHDGVVEFLTRVIELVEASVP